MNLIQRIAELTAELIRCNPSLGDIEPYEVDLTPARLVIHLRPRPVILIDPDPQPRPPINRQNVNHANRNR